MNRWFCAGFVGVAAVACACGSTNTETEADDEPDRRVVAIIDHAAQRDVDVLFVIDGANAFADGQRALVDAFDDFTAALADGDGGLPDLHIGVVSMDVGAGPYNISACDGAGDDGVLQNAPRVAGCAPPAGQFISDIANPDGTRQTNYSGDLQATFGCIAELGIDDCSFEQSLEATRRALDGRNPENAGFLRPDAWLAIVFATNEDDCSASDLTLFDTSQAGLEDPLGPLSSFRCFEFGVECDETDIRKAGPRTNCRPRQDSPYMPPIADYVELVRSLERDPTRIFVAGIIGDPTDVTVSLGDNDHPDIGQGCSGGILRGYDPPVRLHAFLSAFDARHHVAEVCDADYADGMASMGKRLREVMTGSPCLDGPVASPGDCQVHDATGLGTAAEQRVELPACDDPADPDASSNQPCFVIASGATACDSGVRLRTAPAERTVAADVKTVVTCAVE